MEAFLTILSGIAPLTPEEREAMIGIIRTVDLSKGEWWVKEGLRAERLGFIAEGYLRKYYVREGRELTDYFYFDHSFVGDIPSVITGKPSITNIIAMEPTKLLTFSYAELERLCSRYHGIEHLMRVIIERVFVTFYHRSTSFILDTPKERYRRLLEAQPQVLYRAAQYHIASFLGITPQHLSRLRSQR
jgi:CRP-like cAMP-binding protein